MSKTALARNAAESAEAEQRLREINDEIVALKAIKRTASEVVDMLAQQREALLRGDPTRRRMVIGK